MIQGISPKPMIDLGHFLFVIFPTGMLLGEFRHMLVIFPRFALDLLASLLLPYRSKAFLHCCAGSCRYRLRDDMKFRRQGVLNLLKDLLGDSALSMARRSGSFSIPILARPDKLISQLSCPLHHRLLGESRIAIEALDQCRVFAQLLTLLGELGILAVHSLPMRF